MQTTLIDPIRHGLPVGGARYRGHAIDDPLSESGWQQMWDAVGDAAPWNRIVSSPLKRCRDFAEALGTRHGLPLELDDGLREVGFGSLGRPHPRGTAGQRPGRLRGILPRPCRLPAKRRRTAG